MLDGNTRLAWLATVVFLDLNGCHPAFDRPSAVQLVLDVAKGDLDVEEIATRLHVTLDHQLGHRRVEQQHSDGRRLEPSPHPWAGAGW